MIEIRAANESDLDWLVGEMREFDRLYKTKKRLFSDENYVRAKMLEVVKEHVCLVAEEGSERIGLIAGLLTPHFYNPRIGVLSELFWGVNLKYRRTMAASMLMDVLVSIGKEHADWITFNVARFCPVRKESFVRRGFEVSDQVYLMEVE